MLTLLFAILMIAVFGKLLTFAIRAAWSIIKIIGFIILLPFILILLAALVGGVIHFLIPILIIIGIVIIVKACVSRG